MGCGEIEICSINMESKEFNGVKRNAFSVPFFLKPIFK